MYEFISSIPDARLTQYLEAVLSSIYYSTPEYLVDEQNGFRKKIKPAFIIFTQS